MAGEGLTEQPGWPAVGPALVGARFLRRRAGTDDAPDDLPDLIARAGEAEEAALKALRTIMQSGDDPLGQVAIACELDEVDVGVLAVLASCEIDPETLRLALDPPSRSRSRPSGELLLDLFGTDGVRALAPGGRLDRCGFLEVEPGVPVIAAGLAVPPAVLWRLVEEGNDPRELPPGFSTMTAPTDLVGGGERVLVHGADPVRRLQAAARHTRGLLFYTGPAPAGEDEWRTLTRRAGLDGAGIVVELDQAPDAALRRWIEACAHLPWALCSRDPLDLGALTEEPWTEVAAAAAEVSPAEWAVAFPDTPMPARRPTAAQLHSSLNLDSTAMPAAAVVRRVASGTLLKHATRIVPNAHWAELVLPAAQERRLRDLVDRYRYRLGRARRLGTAAVPLTGRGGAVLRSVRHRQDDDRRGHRRTSSASTCSASTCRRW